MPRRKTGKATKLPKNGSTPAAKPPKTEKPAPPKMTADAMLEKLAGAYDNQLLQLPEGNARAQATHGMAAMLMARLRMDSAFDQAFMERRIGAMFESMARSTMDNQSVLLAQQAKKLTAQK